MIGSMDEPFKVNTKVSVEGYKSPALLLSYRKDRKTKKKMALVKFLDTSTFLFTAITKCSLYVEKVYTKAPDADF